MFRVIENRDHERRMRKKKAGNRTRTREKKKEIIDKRTELTRAYTRLHGLNRYISTNERKLLEVIFSAC